MDALLREAEDALDRSLCEEDARDLSLDSVVPSADCSLAMSSPRR